MQRLLWPLAFVATFSVGLATGALVWRGQSAVQEADRDEKVSRLEQQVGTLQARLRAREDLAASRSSGSGAPAGPASSAAASGSLANRFVAVTDTPESLARAGSPPQRSGGGEVSAPGSASTRASASTPSVQAALERFYRYLETVGGDGRERWQQARELVNELRGMGEAAGQALMHVLATGTDSDERRAAARLLGQLQVAQAVPLLRDVIDKDQDLLLRRSAAAGLRQLQTPESLPVMERLVTNANEDRFIRLSAAAGLADSGRPLGVTGLTHIFEESTADGRGREMAFRALTSLGDERPLPFMRQLVTAPVDPGYRLRAIRYLTTHGDRQSLEALQGVMNSSNEQPSIRDAAAQAYTAISRR